MKKLFLMTILALMTLSASAQRSFSYEAGYRGNVAFNGSFGVNNGLVNNSCGLTTSHGYSFGNGAYIGGGAGFSAMFLDGLAIPVFVDAKYNILDWKVSPFVDFRMGLEAILSEYIEYSGMAFLASPGIGVDMGRFTVRAGYQCDAGKASVSFSDGFNGTEYGRMRFKFHAITVSFAVNF